MAQDPAEGVALTSPENEADGIAPSALTTPAMTVGDQVMVAGILLLFMAVALALVLYQYVRGRRDGGAPANGGRGAVVAGAGSGGIDPEVLRSLPVTAYRAKDFEEAVECAVCLAELADGEAARFLPMCGHGFHAECIDMWLHSHSTCPLCRLAVGKPDVSLPPPLALPPASPEPANCTASLPATVLFWGSQGAASATAGGGSSPSSDMAVLVIEIPELAVPAPHDTARSPGSARLRSLRRLWIRGRQGADTSSCSFSSAGAGADIEQAIGTDAGTGICIRVVDASS